MLAAEPPPVEQHTLGTGDRLAAEVLAEGARHRVFSQRPAGDNTDSAWRYSLTGFVGRRLVPALVERGFHVRAMTRHPKDYTGEAEPVGGDVHDADSQAQPLEGVDVAVYLVHSLDSVDFERRDADAAVAFGRVAAEGGVRQIVYLGSTR